MAPNITLKISLRSILNFWHSVDWERTGRWPIFNNDQFTLLYEFDTLQIIYSTKWHLYWVRYKILNNIKLSPSQLCLSRISVLGIDTPYSIYVELINYFGEVVALTIRSQFFIPTVHLNSIRNIYRLPLRILLIGMTSSFSTNDVRMGGSPDEALKACNY